MQFFSKVLCFSLTPKDFSVRNKALRIYYNCDVCKICDSPFINTLKLIFSDKVFSRSSYYKVIILRYSGLLDIFVTTPDSDLLHFAKYVNLAKNVIR